MNTNVDRLTAEISLRDGLQKNWQTLLQLALVVLVVHLYQIEGESFFQVIVLASAGFAISILIPLAYRLQLFVTVSIVGVLWVLGLQDGIALMTIGLGLIGIVHIPIAMTYRVILLLAVIAVLAGLRTGDSPLWSSAMWPILGSMFMFRLVLYARAVASGKVENGIWGTLAYFFMLPNVAFPLFPVIDYQTFNRTHFDKDEREIYDQGMLWISRGLVHLVLYRLVYYYVLNDPRDVFLLSDLVQYMLGTLLLYLKVSGQFHIIVGVLHLFGFRLPETHKLYYLAHSFTELWRRINIYWTEFMMKVFFYPTYFRVKNLGPTRALVLSTIVVFVVTWLLHSYQWFWLRGGFPITVQDTLFWAALGAFVVFGALKELKATRKPRKSAESWNLGMGLKSGTTFLIFCFLWSLWSAESFGLWIWTLGAASNVDLDGIMLLGGIFALIVFFGGFDWEAIQKSPPGRYAWMANSAVRTFVPLLVLTFIVQPLFVGALPTKVGERVLSLAESRLNSQDAAAKHRGYYEQLDIRHKLNDAAEQNLGIMRDNWQTPAGAGIIRERNDILTRDLHPDLEIEWNGNRFTTNRFGMRDRDYSLEKPAGTYRIAFTGPSHLMGNGVADDETFEQLVENRLNDEFLPAGYDRVEILNFGIDGYSIPQQLALIEDRVFDFEPDLILTTVYDQANTMTEGYLQKLIKRDVEPVHQDLRTLLAGAGLDNVSQQGIPMPFAPLRRLTQAMGIPARMPAAEIAGRIHWISRQVDDWAIHRVAEIARSNGAEILMVAVDVVHENPVGIVRNREAIDSAGIPILELLDVFDTENRDKLRIAPWDDHPNAFGHRLIADRLYELLLPWLKKTASNRQVAAPIDATA